MQMASFLGTVGATALAVLVCANAAPITTPPPVLTATGDVKAVYIYASARDTSTLNETSPVSWPVIFCNHSSGSCTAATAGETVDLGVQSGPLVFSLDNLTTTTIFMSNAPDGAGDYHAEISTNYADFGLGPLPSAAASALSGLSDVTYVAWEDLDMAQHSDFDYNDLVFAFSNTVPHAPPIPEPLTLSLFGMGLLGVYGLCRRARAAGK